MMMLRQAAENEWNLQSDAAQRLLRRQDALHLLLLLLLLLWPKSCCGAILAEIWLPKERRNLGGAQRARGGERARSSTGTARPQDLIDQDKLACNNGTVDERERERERRWAPRVTDERASYSSIIPCGQQLLLDTIVVVHSLGHRIERLASLEVETSNVAFFVRLLQGNQRILLIKAAVIQTIQRVR